MTVYKKLEQEIGLYIKLNKDYNLEKSTGIILENVDDQKSHLDANEIDELIKELIYLRMLVIKEKQ